ncbi:hypothetical protein [Halovivax gelatinilyticus]|uniref:hypothetical protein n=1 Tax=Halovivax gelatinilyticus TaxID=2961597 RepID=UPI0020CA7D8B|nr:hypothetical protein [Halovivax gelatinilyticus]
MSNENASNPGDERNAPESNESGSDDVDPTDVEPAQMESSRTNPNRTSSNAPRSDQDLLKAWVVYVAGLFGLAGVAVGLFEILADAVDQTIIEVDDVGGIGQVNEALAQLVTSFSLLSAPYVAILFAVILGAVLGWVFSLDDERTVKLAGAAAAAGTAAFLLPAIVFTSATIDGGSLDVGGALISILLASLVAAGGAAGGVWVTRSYAPPIRSIGRRTE